MLQENEIREILNLLSGRFPNRKAKKQAWENFDQNESDIRQFLLLDFYKNKSLKTDTNKDIIYTNIRTKLCIQNIQKSKTGILHHIQRNYKIAAIILILIGLLSIIAITESTKDNLLTKTRQNHRLNYKSKLLNDTINNTSGQTITRRLIDGSYVYLEPQSQIIVPPLFGKYNKKIFLEGDAIFKINYDKNMPFNVIYHGFKITDLGTIFKLSSSKHKLYIQLIKGKIVIHSLVKDRINKDIYPYVGQIFSWDTIQQTYSLLNYNKTKVTKTIETAKQIDLNNWSFRQNIQFINQPLYLVLDSINNQLPVKTILFSKNDLMTKTFSGVIEKGDNLITVIKLICEANSISYNIHSNLIYINSR